MTIDTASLIARGIYLYLLVGAGVAIWLQVLGGLRRVDETAARGPWGFRLLITPGLVLLWPWMLKAARVNRGHPRAERNAHRCASAECNHTEGAS
ncbi:MAG TPA: hypothetical protein VL357_12895 [Rariglobus sp.]|nr:hypothetical protein [Rariglobus sp.]